MNYIGISQLLDSKCVDVEKAISYVDFILHNTDSLKEELKSTNVKMNEKARADAAMILKFSK